VSNFDINEILNQIKLLFQLFLCFNREITHVFHAEVVRDVSIKHTWKVS